MNSTDQVNTLLNYGYAFLESRCRASINSVGLEASIGFLHEITQPKYPLVYDLQEPFRWIVDKAIITCIEDERFDKKYFFMTDNYILRLNSLAIKRLLEELRQEFNIKIKFKGKYYSWDTIIRLKTRELARYVLGRNKQIDFINPNSKLNSVDSKELREKVLSLSIGEAGELGIKKSTLWHMQKRTNSNKPLYINRKVRSALDNYN